MKQLSLTAAAALRAVRSLYPLWIGVHNLTLVGLFTEQGDRRQRFLLSRVLGLFAIVTADMRIRVVRLLRQQLARHKFVTAATSPFWQTGLTAALYHKKRHQVMDAEA